MKHVVADHALAIQTVTVDGACGPVELQVYETGNGGYFAVDGSWLEQCCDDGTLYIQSPFDDGYSLQLIDSMDDKLNSHASGEPNQPLIDNVIEEIKRHINDGDVTSIDELLAFLPERNLKAFLPDCPYCDGDCVRDENYACDEYQAGGFGD